MLDWALARVVRKLGVFSFDLATLTSAVVMAKRSFHECCCWRKRSIRANWPVRAKINMPKTMFRIGIEVKIRKHHTMAVFPKARPPRSCV